MPEEKIQYGLGDRVIHAKFGEGVILQIEGTGAQKRVQINFKQVGFKWLMLAYTELTPASEQKTISPKPHIETNINADVNNINTNKAKANTNTNHDAPNSGPDSSNIINFKDYMNRIVNAKHFIQNVEKIEQQTVTVIEKQFNNYKGRSNKPKREPIPRLLPEQGGLTDGHRATVNKLIYKYVILLEIIMPKTGKTGLYAIANRAACECAISSGKDGCGSTVRMLDKDFERVETTLKGRIAGLYKNPLVTQKRMLKLSEAHKRFKELGVSEETRRHYQLVKYGHESMADFDVIELADYCDYLNHPAPTFDPYENHQDADQDAPKQPKTKLNTQQKRESILEQWLVKEENDPAFERWLMPYSTDGFYRILKTLDQSLFSVSSDTLRKFMDAQKICSLKPGRKPNE